jgi:beta-galactosidase
MTVTRIAPNGEFPFGTHVYREPFKDYDQLLSDLPVLKRVGFNMIKIQESWAIDEPAEGVYDFRRIERLIAAAAELDLGVYLGLTMEQAPAWMWVKHPDAVMLDSAGAPLRDPTQYCMPADAKPGPCWDHPGAREAAERFMSELVQRLGRFDNLWTWNTFQEIGFWNNLPKNPEFMGYCYCPHTIARFHQWLRERYGSLERLNEVWFTAFSDWSHIDPPRRYTATPMMIDWRFFMDDVYLTEGLRWKTEVIRKADPRQRPVFAHVGHPTVGSGAEWRWAEAGDFFGSSNYPAWDPFHEWDDDAASVESLEQTELYELWHAMMFRNELVRAATGRGRPFWGAEFQGGPISGFLHLGRTPTAQDINRWVLAGLAVGMQGISFWNHRAEHFWHENNGFGLLNRTEQTSDRIEEAGRIARALNAAPALFVDGEPPVAQVAILVNEYLYQFCKGHRGPASELLAADMRGHYARLWRIGVQVDFVEITRAAIGDLDGYRAVIMPFPLALGQDEATIVQEYVRGGGTLISEACPGRHDRYGFATPTEMFDGAEELFGAQHHTVQLVDEPGGIRHWTPAPRGAGEILPATVCTGAGELAGHSLRASLYLQKLLPTTGEVILRAGEDVVGVANSYGTGRAILIGTYAGLSATSHIHPESDQLIERVLTAAGVQPDRVGPLLRRRRVLYGQQAWFLINPTNTEVEQAIPLEEFAFLRDLLDDAVTERRTDSVTVRVPARGLCCLVVERAD